MDSIISSLLQGIISILPPSIISIVFSTITVFITVSFIVKGIMKIKRYMDRFLSKEEHSNICKSEKEGFLREVDTKILKSNDDIVLQIDAVYEELKKCVTKDEFIEKISDMHGEFNEKINDINEETNILADKIDSIYKELNDVEVRIGDKIVESERRQTDNIREMFKMFAAFIKKD